MDAFKKLKQIFPEANEDTRLIFLSPSTRIKIGKVPIQLAPYTIEDGRVVYAAYSPEKNHLYLRLVEFENIFLPSSRHDKIDKPISKEKTNKKDKKE